MVVQSATDLDISLPMHTFTMVYALHAKGRQMPNEITLQPSEIRMAIRDYISRVGIYEDVMGLMTIRVTKNEPYGPTIDVVFLDEDGDLIEDN